MKKILALILVTTFSIATFACDSCGCHIENLDILKAKLIHYHDSGLYEKNQLSIASQAKQYLQTRVAAQKPSDKLAIVLDIDETSLSNYPDMLALNFGGTFEEIVQAEDKGTDAAIKPTLALFQYAKAHHIAVFFITGRTEKARQATIQNLEAVGFQNWDGLSFRPEHYHEKSIAIFKTAARKAIAEQGYDIVLNMGDQESDLRGGYADKTFKLPNPYYLLP
jgi:predicted secreted acid phosphatase